MPRTVALVSDPVPQSDLESIGNQTPANPIYQEGRASTAVLERNAQVRRNALVLASGPERASVPESIGSRVRPIAPALGDHPRLQSVQASTADQMPSNALALRNDLEQVSDPDWIGGPRRSALGQVRGRAQPRGPDLASGLGLTRAEGLWNDQRQNVLESIAALAGWNNLAASNGLVSIVVQQRLNAPVSASDPVAVGRPLIHGLA